MSREARIWLRWSLIIGVSLACAVASRAQLASLLGPEKEALVYDGDLKTDSGGIEVTSWGSGEAKSVSDTSYVGPEVLKVTSQGPYQGIVLHLARAVDLPEFTVAKESYVDLRILPGQVPKPTETLESTRSTRGTSGRVGRTGGTTGGTGTLGGRTGGTSRRNAGRRGGGGGWMDPGPAGDPEFQVMLTGRMGREGGGGGRRGGGGGAEGGGRRGGAGQRRGTAAQQTGAARQPAAAGNPAAAGPQTKAFTLTRVRVTLFTDAGPLTANSAPVAIMAKDKRGWLAVMVPLSQFAGIAEAKVVTAIGVYADQTDVFYLGQVRLVIDHTAVRALVKADPSITVVNRVVEFTAEVSGGAIDPECSWDFDSSDGIQRQAVGDKAKFIFKKRGDYIVTCTIADRAGVREPLVKMIGVHVEGGATSAE